MKERFKKVIHAAALFLGRLCKYLCILLLTCITVITLMQVSCRYFLGFAFSWAEEIVRYMGVYAAFFGVCLAYETGDLISVQVVMTRLPLRLRNVLSKLTSAINLFFTFAVICTSYPLIKNLVVFSQPSPALHIPMYVPYLAIPITMFILFIFFINSALIDEIKE